MTMSAAISSSESGLNKIGAPLQRTFGRARLSFHQSDQLTRLKTLYQEGAAKVRFPKVSNGSPPEAVIINTAGGLTGGDRIAVDADIGDDAAVVITSQACEKIYRSSGGKAHVENRLQLGRGTVCAWLPQETILFDKARLERSLEVDLAEDATLLAVEPLILGRREMGETVRDGQLRDRWRIRRNGRLLQAEELRLDGDIDQLTRSAPLLSGYTSTATVLLVAPDVEQHIDSVRDLIESIDKGGGQTGASAWDGRLVIRLLAVSGMAMRSVLIPVIQFLLKRMTPLDRPMALPRVWTT